MDTTPYGKARRYGAPRRMLRFGEVRPVRAESFSHNVSIKWFWEGTPRSKIVN